MADGNVSGAGGGGGGEDDLSESWFDKLIEKHSNEMMSIINCAEQVLFPPPKGHGQWHRSQEKDMKPQWKIQQGLIR